jgi:hypothetical protein
MTHQRIRSFVARGQASRGDVFCPVTITGSYPTLAPDPARCKVMPDMDSLSALMDSVVDTEHRTDLKGRTDNGRSIWIPNFQIGTYTGSRAPDQMNNEQVVWEGVADFFVEGDLEAFDGSDGTIVLSISTSSTPISDAGVMYMPYDDGTIRIWEDRERRGIHWATALGEAEFIDRFVYIPDDEIGADEALTRVKKSQITIEVRPGNAVSLQDILASLEQELQEALWLLSFLSRKRVVWYEAEALFLPKDNLSQDPRKAVARRNAWFGYEKELVSPSDDLLVKQGRLKDGLFQQLLDSYVSSSHYDTIRQTIVYLLVSCERAYIENEYTSVYIAFECLVYGLGKEHSKDLLLRSNQFKKLAKKLREVVRDSVQDEETVQRIIKKLPELRRCPFIDQLSDLLEEYDLDIAALWPPGIDVEEELRSLIKRRNVYLHQGRMEDVEAYVFDLDRLRSLVELWILKLLNCPDEALNPAATGRLVSITSQLGH